MFLARFLLNTRDFLIEDASDTNAYEFGTWQQVCVDNDVSGANATTCIVLATTSRARITLRLLNQTESQIFVSRSDSI